MTTGSADILQQIAEHRRRRLTETAPPAEPHSLAEDQQGESGSAATPFSAALAAKQGKAIIAEVKLGSPRLGSLVDRIDPYDQARIYAEHGAADKLAHGP